MRLGTSPVPQVTVRQTADGVYRNWDADVSAERCFAGTHLQVSPGASAPYVQLVNPVASGVQILLDAVTLTSDTACTFIMGRTTALLSTQYGNWQNKYLGGAVSQGVFYAQNGAAAFLATLYRVAVLADTPFTLVFTRPILIDPGHQFMVGASTVSTTIQLNAEGREI